MSDIFDGLDFNPSFDRDELLKELFKENLRLRAQISAVYNLLAESFVRQWGKSKNEAEAMLHSLYVESAEEIIVNHPMLADAWKEKIKDQLGL